MRNVFGAIAVLCSVLSFASQASLQSYDAGNLNPNPTAQGWVADRSVARGLWIQQQVKRFISSMEPADEANGEWFQLQRYIAQRIALAGTT